VKGRREGSDLAPGEATSTRALTCRFGLATDLTSSCLILVGSCCCLTRVEYFFNYAPTLPLPLFLWVAARFRLLNPLLARSLLPTALPGFPLLFEGFLPHIDPLSVLPCSRRRSLTLESQIGSGRRCNLVRGQEAVWASRLPPMAALLVSHHRLISYSDSLRYFRKAFELCEPRSVDTPRDALNERWEGMELTNLPRLLRLLLVQTTTRKTMQGLMFGMADNIWTGARAMETRIFHVHGKGLSKVNSTPPFPASSSFESLGKQIDLGGGFLELDLADWVTTTIYEGATPGLFGPSLLASSISTSCLSPERLRNAFAAFDTAFPLLASGLIPTFLYSSIPPIASHFGEWVPAGLLGLPDWVDATKWDGRRFVEGEGEGLGTRSRRVREDRASGEASRSWARRVASYESQVQRLLFHSPSRDGDPPVRRSEPRVRRTQSISIIALALSAFEVEPLKLTSSAEKGRHCGSRKARMGLPP
jgi:hypothetical protein